MRVDFNVLHIIQLFLWKLQFQASKVSALHCGLLCVINDKYWGKSKWHLRLISPWQERKCMCLCHFFLTVHHALFPTHWAAHSLSLFPIYFPSLKEFWEPISFPSFFFSILALFDCDQCAASRRKSNAAVVKKEATCWTFALWFSIYQWLIWHNLTVTPTGKWSHLSETFFIMIYKSKAWVYQVSSGVWRISALDGCSIETSLHHRLFSALCHSYFLSIHLFPFCLEMPC